LDMMQQNLVVEALLSNYHTVFNRWFLFPWIGPSTHITKHLGPIGWN
jgi:hypothetical protein